MRLFSPPSGSAESSSPTQLQQQGKAWHGTLCAAHCTCLAANLCLALLTCPRCYLDAVLPTVLPPVLSRLPAGQGIVYEALDMSASANMCRCTASCTASCTACRPGPRVRGAGHERPAAVHRGGHHPPGGQQPGGLHHRPQEVAVQPLLHRWVLGNVLLPAGRGWQGGAGWRGLAAEPMRVAMRQNLPGWVLAGRCLVDSWVLRSAAAS